MPRWPKYTCIRCGGDIMTEEVMRMNDGDYHPECWHTRRGT